MLEARAQSELETQRAQKRRRDGALAAVEWYTASPEGFVPDEFVSSEVKRERDRALGMGARITRRDFLNGVALTVGAAIVPAIVPAIIPPEMWAAAAADLVAQDVPGYYPPGKTGLRGDHAGSFETMHKVRDGAFWEDAPKAVDTGESYDLVIVGRHAS